jgi:hypothetical protein
LKWLRPLLAPSRGQLPSQNIVGTCLYQQT